MNYLYINKNENTKFVVVESVFVHTTQNKLINQSIAKYNIVFVRRNGSRRLFEGQNEDKADVVCHNTENNDDYEEPLFNIEL